MGAHVLQLLDPRFGRTREKPTRFHSLDKSNLPLFAVKIKDAMFSKEWVQSCGKRLAESNKGRLFSPPALQFLTVHFNRIEYSGDPLWIKGWLHAYNFETDEAFVVLKHAIDIIHDEGIEAVSEVMVIYAGSENARAWYPWREAQHVSH